MTFLPIAGRELRVAARKRSTFWLRVVAASFGLLVGGACLLISALSGVGRIGSALFGILTWMSVIAALFAGLFFTSDSVSEEKREGTLGFLFLTDLRGYDVVAGKFLATSLRGIYALLALFPVLGISFMLGGVTGGEFWRTNLALLNALICSLMAGLFVSALSRDSQKAMAATLLLLLALIFGGPALDAGFAALRKQAFQPVLSLLSPGYVFVNAGAWQGSPFWNSLLVSQVLCWVLFLSACLLVPRAWQERSRRGSGVSSMAYRWRYGHPKRRAQLRYRLMDRNPILWLACREQWQSVGIWLLSFLALASLATIAFSGLPRTMWFAWPYLEIMFTWLLYLWAASQSCRFFIEARKNGLLELLLSAPVSAGRIISGHWKGLMRMFLVPVLVLIATQIICSVVYQIALGRWTGGGPASFNVETLVLIATTVVSTLLKTLSNLCALVWFGMWMGLTSKGANWATAKTFAFVYVLPQLVIWFVGAVVGLALLLPWLMKFAGATSSAPMVFYSAVTAVVYAFLALGKNLGFFLLARNRLHQSFREYVTGVKERPVRRAIMLPAAPPLATTPS